MGDAGKCQGAEVGASHGGLLIPQLCAGDGGGRQAGTRGAR